MDGRTDGQTDTQNFGGYNIIPRHFLVAGHKNGCKNKGIKACNQRSNFPHGSIIIH